jgi:hypothetical protein
MPRPSWGQANEVSVLVNTTRIDDLDGFAAGVARPRIDRRLPIAVATLCAVFACFFAIGRATDTASRSRAEASSTLPVASAGAAIPRRLSDTSPIEIFASAPRPRKRSTPVRAASLPGSSIRAVSGPAQAASTEVASPPSVPVAPSQPTRSFSPEPAQSSPAPVGGSNGSSGSGSGSSRHSSSGGGSFDSSG